MAPMCSGELHKGKKVRLGGLGEASHGDSGTTTTVAYGGMTMSLIGAKGGSFR